MWQPALVFEQSYQGNRPSWTRVSCFVTNGSHGLKKLGVLSGLEMRRKGQRIRISIGVMGRAMPVLNGEVRDETAVEQSLATLQRA